MYQNKILNDSLLGTKLICLSRVVLQVNSRTVNYYHIALTVETRTI